MNIICLAVIRGGEMQYEEFSALTIAAIYGVATADVPGGADAF